MREISRQCLLTCDNLSKKQTEWREKFTLPQWAMRGTQAPCG